MQKADLGYSYRMNAAGMGGGDVDKHIQLEMI